jgi:hypothetical protein
MFHDIGRPLERPERFVETVLDEEDIDIHVEWRDDRWRKSEFITARRLLGSLACFAASHPSAGDRWDGGGVEDERVGSVADDWTAIYNSFGSHAVLSSFNMLGDIVRKAQAAGEISNRPFVVSNAVPAALAILLHDWHLWENAKKWGLYPIDGSVLPMAALLVFIDCWDDYRRRVGAPPVLIDRYEVTPAGVDVHVRWLSASALEGERVKYAALDRCIRNLPFKLKVMPFFKGL